jgi:RNA polymerase sigma factor FliA
MLKSKDTIGGVPVAELMVWVRRIAYRLVRRLPRQVQVDDLISAGLEGCLMAESRYDPKLQQDFRIFAESRARGEMLDELRRLDPLGRDTRDASTREKNVRHVLRQELGREPEHHEIARAMGISDEAHQKLLHHVANVHLLSLDELAEREVGGGYMPADNADPIVDVVDQIVKAGEVDRALRCLAPRHERAMRLYFFEGLTFLQAGEQLRVTESRVCQMVGESLNQLRSIIESVRRGERALRTTSDAEDPVVAPSDDPFGDELATTGDALDALLGGGSLSRDHDKGS